MRESKTLDVPIGLAIDATKFAEKYGITAALHALRCELAEKLAERGIEDSIIEAICERIDRSTADAESFLPPKRKTEKKPKPKGIQEVLFTDPKEVQDALFSE